jgi:hypothetical protein
MAGRWLGLFDVLEHHAGYGSTLRLEAEFTLQDERSVFHSGSRVSHRARA